MAKKPFNFDDTPVSKVSDDIRTHSVHKSGLNGLKTGDNDIFPACNTENNENIEINSIAFNQKTNLKPQKKSKGIRIDLPIDKYMKLVAIKEYTGKTLQELVVNSVICFIDDFYGKGNTTSNV